MIIDQKGELTGIIGEDTAEVYLKGGSKVIVVARSTFDNMSDKKEIRVKHKPTETFTLAPETTTINVGDVVNLTSTITPENASKFISYTSSDTDIIIVDANGSVTTAENIQKYGSATITGTTLDGQIAIVTITVIDPNPVVDDSTE